MTFLTNEQAMKLANRMKKIPDCSSFGSIWELICDAVARGNIIAVEGRQIVKEDGNDQEDEP